MSTRQDIRKPHKVLLSKCQGRLVEGRDQYGEWAYWHGEGHMYGWYSQPLPGVEYPVMAE